MKRKRSTKQRQARSQARQDRKARKSRPNLRGLVRVSRRQVRQTRSRQPERQAECQACPFNAGGVCIADTYIADTYAAAALDEAASLPNAGESHPVDQDPGGEL